MGTASRRCCLGPSFMHIYWIIIWACCLAVHQLLYRFTDGRLAVYREVFLCLCYVCWIGWCWYIQQLLKMLFPSIALFSLSHGCLPLFAFLWPFWLAKLSWKFLCGVVQVLVESCTWRRFYHEPQFLPQTPDLLAPLIEIQFCDWCITLRWTYQGQELSLFCTNSTTVDSTMSRACQKNCSLATFLD